MVDKAQLSKVLKDAMKGGKSSFGARESLTAMKGSKAVLCTASLKPELGRRLREEAKKHDVPVIELPETSAELARLVGKPFKVSAMTLRNVSDADVKQLLR
jgi:large subunit ribosomal protein L30e